MKLYTERTTISPISKKDIPEILEMYAEPDSFKYILPHKDKTEVHYQDFLNGKIESNNITIGFWTVRLKETNSFIGTVNLNQFQGTGMTHIGCHLKRTFWNKGFATELMIQLIDYGFENRNLKAIHGIVEENNLVSSKLMRSLGFELYKEKLDDEVKLKIYKKNR